VHRQARGLVDREQGVVLVEDLEHEGFAARRQGA
jgi:hypothetical protein